MLPCNFTGLTEPDLVDSRDTALVLRLIDEVLNDIAGVLQVLGDIAADPVSGISPLALHQVSQHGASTVAGWSSPAQTDGAVGGVRHTGVHHWARRI